MKREELVTEEKEVKEEKSRLNGSEKADPKKMKEKENLEKEEFEEPEEAEINCYMESEEDTPSEELFHLYLKERYKVIKNEYHTLQVAHLEAKATHNEEASNRLTQTFRDNYKSRRWVVVQLRRAGDVLKDPYVPLSARK